MNGFTTRPRRVAIATAAALLLTMGACGGVSESSGSGGSGGAGGAASGDYYGAVLDLEPYTAPEVTLTSTLGDGDGEAYDIAADTTAPLTLVFFGYAECPDICQMVMANIASALVRLSDSEREQIDVLFVTTDPARDTVPALRDYLARFDPGFVGLTGDLDTLAEAGEAFHVYFESGEPLPSGGYDVTHTDQVYAVVEDDTVPILWTRDISPHELATDLATLLAQN